MLFFEWELYRCAYHLISSDVGMWEVGSKCLKVKYTITFCFLLIRSLQMSHSLAGGR